VARNLIVLHGGLSTRERKDALASLAAIPGDEERLVVATGRCVGEGFDDPRLDTLVLALPVAWRGTVVQYAGRLHRKHAGKTDVRIHDYRDENVPVLARMLEKRIRAYRAIGYEIEDAGTRRRPPSTSSSTTTGRSSSYTGPLEVNPHVRLVFTVVLFRNVGLHLCRPTLVSPASTFAIRRATGPTAGELVAGEHAMLGSSGALRVENNVPGRRFSSNHCV
jgi:hypothetical protein